MSSSHGNPFTLSPLDSDPGNHTADQDKSLLLGDRLAHEPSSGSADSSADGSSSSHHARPMALADAKRRLKQIYLSLPTEDLKPFDDFVFETMSVYSTREEGSFFRRIIVERFLLLAGLMAFQSLSSEIISHFQGFIKEHMIVTLFLTMLVGAGGNAGSQSAVNIIRGMATGRVTGFSAVIPELVNGLVLATLLVFCGFARVYFLHAGTLDECLAVVASLFLIVATSVVIGAALPLMLDRCGFDGAHAGPLIQVVMDISGVWTTCVVCEAVLGGTPGGDTLAGHAPHAGVLRNHSFFRLAPSHGAGGAG
jgi:cation transporter-like permease